MDHFHQRDHVFNRSFRQYSMAEIKNVSRPSLSLSENSFHLLSQYLLICKQDDGIEISHHRHVVTDTLPAFVETHAPVEPDHVAAGFTHQLEQRRSTRTEMDYRHARSDIPDHVARVRQHEFAIVIRAQAPDPRVKQLHRLRARCDLRIQVLRETSRD